MDVARMNYRKLFDTTALVPPPPPEIMAMANNMVSGAAAAQVIAQAVLSGEAAYWISDDCQLAVVAPRQWRDLTPDSE
jgi:hypothetical protein